MLSPFNALKCHNRRMVYLQSRIDPNHQRGVWVACKSWKCPACAQVHKQRWKKRVEQTLREYGGSVYVWTGSLAEWDSCIQRKLRRLDGNAYRVRVGDHIVLFADTSLPGCQAESLEEAVRHARATIDAIPLVRSQRPVTACGSWPSPPPLNDDTEPKNWELLGDSKITQAEVVEVLREFGIDPKPNSGAEVEPKLQWKLPTSWDDAQRWAFRLRFRLVRRRLMKQRAEAKRLADVTNGP